MKKLILLGAISLATAANAQINIYHVGESTDISGTLVTVPITDAKTYYYMDVENTESSMRELDIRRIVISELAGTSDEICWSGPGGADGNCFVPLPGTTVFETDNNPDIDPGAKGILQPYHVWNEVSGSCTYRYIVYDSNTLEDLDSIDIEFVGYLGLEDEMEASFNVYPNPTEGNVTITNADNLATAVAIYSITGELVFTTALEEGQNTLDLESLEAGTYFYAIKNGENVLRNDKLIIE